MSDNTPVTPQLDETYAEKRGPHVHIINKHTGLTERIIADTPTRHTPQELVEVTLDDGTRVMVQKAIAPTVKGTWDMPFSPITVDLMCQRILNGEGVTDICDTLGFPSYVTFTRWRREHSWIDEAISKARVDRAERHRDKVMKYADAAVSTKDPINATNTKIEAHKWAAAIDDPSRYSPKAKLDASISLPTQINIITGIDRTPIVETNHKDVSDDQNTKREDPVQS